MRNYIGLGKHFPFVAAAAANSGQMVVVGAVFGVLQDTVAIGDTGVLVREGVFELPKTSAQAWTVGAKLYWDATNLVCTTTASGNTLIGAAYAVAVNPSATGLVYLDGVIR